MRFHEHLENLEQDIRYAARGLIRRPAFTAVAVLTIGIGVGATTTVFSAVNALLLRPLPFSRPEELMKVSLTAPADGARPANNDVLWIYPRAATFRADQQEFNGTATRGVGAGLSLLSQSRLLRHQHVYEMEVEHADLRGRGWLIAIDAEQPRERETNERENDRVSEYSDPLKTHVANRGANDTREGERPGNQQAMSRTSGEATTLEHGGSEQ